MTKPVAPEFSHIIRPSTVPQGRDGAVYELEASPAERAALARRFAFLDLAFLGAKMSVRRVKGGEGVRLHGHITARVAQRCVVTLEPVVSDVDAHFETLLLEESDYAGDAIDPEEDVDLYSGDAVDIGEIAAEELALSLDPYPRAAEAAAGAAQPGGTDPESRIEAAEKPAKYRPFEALAGLKRRK